MPNTKTKCLLFLVTFFGCTDIPDELREDAESDGICGNSIYNPSTNFCFGGNVYAKCDGLRYNPTTQICQGIAVTYARCGSMMWGGYSYKPLEQGCCVSDIFSLADQRCQNGVVETKCGTDWYNQSNQKRCERNVVETKCGSGWYNASNSNLRCWENVIKTKCGTSSDWYDSKTQFCQSGTNAVKPLCGTLLYASTQYCKNSTTPTQYGSLEYAGQIYRTVEIGTQTWMAENLNYNASNSRCYNDYTGGDRQGNCAKYGRLYNWATAMDIDASCNTSTISTCGATVSSKHKGICPVGWHIPSNADWNVLMKSIDPSCSDNNDCASAGTKLKATSYWNSFNVGTDNYGFTALLGGSGYSDGSFRFVGDYGLWWSATEYDDSHAYYRYMGCNYAYVRSDHDDKSRLFSVRCVQNKA